MSRFVEVLAPSRIHLGLYALGNGQPRRYGGIGFMIAEPAWRLQFVAKGPFTVSGPEAERVSAAARKWQQFHQLRELPACQVSVEAAPPAHVGLGTGTQLALSVAAGLCAVTGHDCGPPELLARSVGRGKRSAVGSYGFVHGGLIAERGCLADEPFPPLDARLELPAAWRFVLLRPQGETPIFGAEEEARMAALPASPGDLTTALITEAREELLPATATGDFARFSASVYRFNRLSGELFAAAQGGPYNGPAVTRLVARCRELGIVGVGQSSWGPTVFAAFENQTMAEDFMKCLQSDISADQLDAMITGACNQGATVRQGELRT